MIKKWLEKKGIRVLTDYEKQLFDTSKASLKLSKLKYFVEGDLDGAILECKKSVAYCTTEENTKWGLFLAKKKGDLK